MSDKEISLTVDYSTEKFDAKKIKEVMLAIEDAVGNVDDTAIYISVEEV